ncbi:hypothetical protein JRQ81_007035, partial [Phrynocephalus forsythii]
SVAIMEMERASSVLRFQTISENKDDLPELTTTILADALGIEKEELENEMDQLYRVNSSYARTKNSTCSTCNICEKNSKR